MPKHRPQHEKLFAPQPTCGSKRCYHRKTEAEQVKSEQEIMTPGLELSIYHCTSCGSYHLTRLGGDHTSTN